MAKKLPDVVVVGPYVFTRDHSTGTAARKRWVCPTALVGYLERSAVGTWRYVGSPISRWVADRGWHDSPIAAYRNALELQIAGVRRAADLDVSILTRELAAAPYLDDGVTDDEGDR